MIKGVLFIVAYGRAYRRALDHMGVMTRVCVWRVGGVSKLVVDWAGDKTDGRTAGRSCRVSRLS